MDGEPAFPLGIGIGLAAGEAVPIEGGYRGGALNLAARLCSIAGPGQILASETVTSLAGPVDVLRLVERRPVRVKGIERPVRALEVIPELALPPVPKPPRPSRRRRGLVLMAIGAAVIAGAAIAAVLTLSGGSSAKVEAVGNAIAAIDGDAVEYTLVGKTPSTIAVGEGAVWVLNADDRTISKIDPQTKEVETFGTGGTTTDLAVGEGAVWVGNGAQGRALATSPPRPASRRSIRTRPACARRRFFPAAQATRTCGPPASPACWGVSQLAVGAGAVWAINPDLTVSRIDPDTGKRDAKSRSTAGGAIAAGSEGVWALGGDGPLVAGSIRARTSSRQTIELGCGRPRPGSRSAPARSGRPMPRQGLLWRIEPGRDPATRTIDIGVGATAVTLGDGAVWVANFVSDEVSRVDPRHERGDGRRFRLQARRLRWQRGRGRPGSASRGRRAVTACPASVCGAVL